MRAKGVHCREFRENEIPDRKFVNDIYTHDLAKLLGLSGLEEELTTARQHDPELDQQWSTVKNWDEKSRYSLWTAEQADAMINAIGGDGGIGGLLQWLSIRW